MMNLTKEQLYNALDKIIQYHNDNNEIERIIFCSECNEIILDSENISITCMNDYCNFCLCDVCEEKNEHVNRYKICNCEMDDYYCCYCKKVNGTMCICNKISPCCYIDLEIYHSDCMDKITIELEHKLPKVLCAIIIEYIFPTENDKLKREYDKFPLIERLDMELYPPRDQDEPESFGYEQDYSSTITKEQLDKELDEYMAKRRSFET